MTSLALLCLVAIRPMQALSLFAFLFCFALIVYVLFGYPLLLGRIARHHNHPVHKDDRERSVSVLLAVRNGEEFIRQKLQSLLAIDYPRELVQILVISDGSDDRTDEIVREFADKGVRLLRVPRGGKSAALNAGLTYATGEILVFTDVRQKVDSHALHSLVADFGDPSVGAVSGELTIVNEQTAEEVDTGLYWKYELWLRETMSLIHSSFGCTGALYGIRHSLVENFPSGILLDDTYLPLTALFKGYRIIYEPTARMFDYPTTLDSEFRRKVRTQAGLYQLLKIMPELWSHGNPMRFHYLSGKFGRMIVPYCMIVMALATFGLPPGLRIYAATSQILFYLVAMLDPAIPAKFPLKQLSSAVRAFVVLMAASLVAVEIFFVPATSLWKETTVRHGSA